MTPPTKIEAGQMWQSGDTVVLIIDDEGILHNVIIRSTFSCCAMGAFKGDQLDAFLSYTYLGSI